MLCGVLSCVRCACVCVCLFQQKTAYEMRISDWSSDVCSSDLLPAAGRDAHAEFLEVHIPGARFLALARLVDTASDVPQALPRPEQLANELATLGIGPGDRIVFYDDSAVKTSARVWFLFRAHGIGNVAILGGGRAQGQEEHRVGEGVASSCRFRWLSYN